MTRMHCVPQIARIIRVIGGAKPIRVILNQTPKAHIKNLTKIVVRSRRKGQKIWKTKQHKGFLEISTQ